MFSAPRPPAEVADPGNVKAQRLDTNQQTIPLGYLSGRRWFPLTWIISKVYNPTVTEKTGGGSGKSGGKGGGGSKTLTYGGDLAGVVACGPGDFFEAVRINGQIVWVGGISRDGSNPTHCEISIPGFVDTLRLHWGTADQPADWIVLNTGGETHPNYKDDIIVELKGSKWGTSNTPFNVEVLLERAPSVDGLDGNRTREGANAVTAMAEVLANDYYGVGLSDIVDISTASTLCAALAAREKTVPVPGDDSHVAKMLYVSAYLKERQTVRSFLGSVMENYDGWARQKGGKIEFGYFPHDGTVPGDLLELTLHDLAEDPSFGNPGFDDDSIITDTTVTGPDRDLDLEDSSQIGTNAAARRRLNQTILKTFPRPFVMTSYQQREQAHELANTYSKPEDAVEVAFRREKAKMLFPGDRFILNYGPSSSRQVFRVARRRDPSRGGILYLSIVTERTIAPLTFIPAADPVPALPAPPAPTPVVNAAIFQFPATGEFEGVPTVAPLVERPDAHVVGFAVALSTDDSTYDEIDRTAHWALRATLHTTITSGSASMTIDASGLDLTSILVSQSAAQRDNDALLLFIGTEIISIGAVTALGGGQYSLAILRGRMDTTAAAHTASAICYLIARENLLTIQHEALPVAGGTRYFKLPTFTDTDEQELADALKLTVSIAALTMPAPTSLSVTARTGYNEIKWSPPATGKPAEYGIYRYTSNVSGSATKIAENDGTFYNDSTAVAGTDYWYWITAIYFGETESARTAAGTVTTLAGAIGDLTPSNPTPATFNTSGTYQATDGTTFSSITVNVPALSTNAKWQNILYRKTGAGEYLIAAQLTNTGTTTCRIDDLTPSVSYDIASQEWAPGRGSSVVAATGSPFTAPGAGNPNAPTSIVCSTTASDLTSAPPRFDATGGKMKVLKVSWAASTSPDVTFYEIHTDALTGGGPFTQDDNDIRTKGNETFAFIYFAVGTSGFVPEVRAVSRSTLRSSYTVFGSVASNTSSYGTANMAEQAASSVAVTGGTVDVATLKKSGTAVVTEARTINSQPLSSDVTLTASDVSAVPTTRTVNGHALSSNVTITAADLSLGTSDNVHFGQIAVNGAIFKDHSVYDGWTPRIYTGDLSVGGDSIEFQMSGGHLYYRANGGSAVLIV